MADEETTTKVSAPYASVWDAIADTPDEAENLKVRSALMSAIRGKIEEFGWSQRTAAQNMRITQPRVSDLVNGKLDLFSVDALINLGAVVGVHMHVVSYDDADEPEAIAL